MRTEEEKKKHAEYMRQYMRAHPEQRRKNLERTRKYREADPEIRQREYLRNREAYIAREKAYRAANPDKIREYERKRYLENPDRKAAIIARTKKLRSEGKRNRQTDAKYRADHQAEIKAYNRKYFKEHPDVTRQSNHRRRAQKYVAPFETFRSAEIYARDKWTCGICGEPVDKHLPHRDPMSASLDHIVPLARGGHHTRANCQLSHLSCNKKKSCSQA